MTKTSKLLIFGFLLSFFLAVMIIFFTYSSFSNLSYITPVIISYVLATVNFCAALIIIKISIKKKTELFLKKFVTGLLIRISILLFIVFACLKFLELNQNSFIFSFLFFYIFYLIIEVFYLNLMKN